MKNVFIFSLTGGKSALAKDEPLLWPKHKMIPNGLSDKGEDIMQNGIDVANVNGAVDWQQVKASGIDFAIIRAGWTH